MDTSDSSSLPAGPGRPALLQGWRLWALLGGALLLGVVLLRAGKGDAAPKVTSRAVPVAVAQARQGDLPIHLTGLGTVTALNNVTVKTRVDGQLVRIAFTEGQFVKEGDLLAEIDPRPFQVQLQQAEGQLAKDQAAFQNASADLRRLQGLVQQGIISRQQLDTQTSTVAQYEAALQSDRAQVQGARLNLTYSRITAPISGRVGLRLVDAGNMVRAADTTGIATIAPIQPITVLFAVPADAIQKVLSRNAQGARLPVEAWDRDLKARLATGTLSAIDNQVDTATGTVRLKALFANADRTLFPNQFVNAQLLLDSLKGVVIIPSSAIQRGPQGAFVYVVKADSTVELRGVEVAGTDGDDTAIGKGLAGGETVVTDGLEKLRPGSKVALPKPVPAKG